MSRKKARTRRKQKKQKQRQNLMIAGVVLAIVGGIALFALSNRAGTYSERFDLDPILGNPDAPVSIVEYSSYGCQSCRVFHQSGILDQILEEYEGQVNFIFRDMPIISPAYDLMTGQLAQCVLDQSNDLFWRFHDMMYTVAQPGSSTREALVANAGRLGVDTGALNACYDSGVHVNTVRYDQQRGIDLGIRGTPTFFINGERLFTFTADGLRQAVEHALNAA